MKKLTFVLFFLFIGCALLFAGGTQEKETTGTGAAGEPLSGNTAAVTQADGCR